MTTAKITHARITDMPIGLLDPMPSIMVRVADGQEQRLFEYYPDELTFCAAEFIGLTVEEGKSLKRSKDHAFLKS